MSKLAATNALSKKKIPKNTSFQSTAYVKYNSVEDRYFVVYPEYKVLYEPKGELSLSSDKLKYFWRGKLWGLYINDKGKIVDKAKGSAVALTDEFKSTDDFFAMTIFSHDPTFGFNSLGNEYFIAYHLVPLTILEPIIYGLIYK